MSDYVLSCPQCEARVPPDELVSDDSEEGVWVCPECGESADDADWVEAEA